MKTPKPPSTRLWVIQACKAATAVIFRRGPSGVVQLIKWNLDSDTFEPGQWFKGRVYERRCDLSPDGVFLIYFAANYREPLYSWTAISRIPYFSALALWPKGDCWNGGGHFVGPRQIHLDRPSSESAPHPEFATGCRRFPISPHPTYRGEDNPVWHHTLKRDGWSPFHTGKWEQAAKREGYWWKAKEPEIWRKRRSKTGLLLEMAIKALHQTNGPWYVTTYRVINSSGAEIADLGPTDWGDWDKNGDLLYALAGRIYRQSFQNGVPAPARMLGDFREHKFSEVPPPAWAKNF